MGMLHIPKYQVDKIRGTFKLMTSWWTPGIDKKELCMSSIRKGAKRFTESTQYSQEQTLEDAQPIPKRHKQFLFKWTQSK